MSTGKVGPRPSVPPQPKSTRPVDTETGRPTRKGFRGSSKFEAHTPRERVPRQLDSTGGVTSVGSVDDAKALQTQRELSAARQELGRLELRVEAQPVLNLSPDIREQLANLKARVASLEKVEASQPEASVLKGRFVVFNERMGELEKTMGKGAAATIARQTYYNGPTWNAPSLTLPATAGAIDAAGLPHGQFNPGVAAGGFDGEMMTADGHQVDMGHVAAALDWQVNNHVGLTPGDVTVVGDLASAMRETSSGSPSAVAAQKAVAREGNGDWNGDLDGQNLAHRMAQNPNLSITDALKGYYGTGEDKNRVNEWASHSPYVVRDASNKPVLDKDGNFTFTPQLKAEAESFLYKLSLGQKSGSDVDGQGVVDAFGRYLAANR